MKKTKKIFIATLAFLAFAGCKESKTTNTEATETTSETVVAEATVAPIEGDMVFVNRMLVMSESEIIKTEGEALRTKIENTQKKFAQKEQALNAALQNLQEKYQKGLITTRDAQTEQEKLQKNMVVLQNQAQKELPALQEEEMVLTNRVNDLVLRAVKAINAKGQYKMIVDTSALLDYDESLDITSLVLAKVNELYKAEKEEAKKN